MKRIGLLVLMCLMFFAAQAAPNNNAINETLQVLQFKGSATYTYMQDKEVHYAQFEYCGIGFCQAIKGVATDKTTRPLLAVAYLWLAYIDDDASVTNWFHISPLAFAVDNVTDREKVLQQWRPKHCDSPEQANIVICTLKHLVSEHQLTYYFIRYDEGQRNSSVEPWEKYLTVEQYIKHEKRLAKHLNKN